MPAKNSVKEYEENGFYHIYNRGVEKRDVFLDDDDYKKFLSYLKVYLDKPNLQGLTLKAEDGKTIPPSRVLRNFNGEIDLQAYCLMPNHFHFLIHQHDERSIASFMQALITKYSMYFNKKYKRVGGLFQGRYKTVRIVSEEQYTYVSKYIHRNPIDLPSGSDPEGLMKYKYSSYGNYLGLFKQSWVKTEDILSYFSKTSPRNTYQAFVEETGDISMIYKEMIDLDE
ncbi:transposase [Candidatus Woesebacteria bacterium]|nr:transposase [Candidatus Woesebacteria bacterium]